MTSAKSLALRRLAYAGASLLLPFAIPAIVGGLIRPAGLTSVVAGVASLAIGTALWFYFIFRWCPRCPACRASRARFVRVGDTLQLRCERCGYDEPTGETYPGTP